MRRQAGKRQRHHRRVRPRHGAHRQALRDRGPHQPVAGIGDQRRPGIRHQGEALAPPAGAPARAGSGHPRCGRAGGASSPQRHAARAWRPLPCVSSQSTASASRSASSARGDRSPRLPIGVATSVSRPPPPPLPPRRSAGATFGRRGFRRFACQFSSAPCRRCRRAASSAAVGWLAAALLLRCSCPPPPACRNPRPGSAPIPGAPARRAARGSASGCCCPCPARNRQLGQAMLNAAQMALFDQGGPGNRVPAARHRRHRRRRGGGGPRRHGAGRAGAGRPPDPGRDRRRRRRPCAPAARPCSPSPTMRPRPAAGCGCSALTPAEQAERDHRRRRRGRGAALRPAGAGRRIRPPAVAWACRRACPPSPSPPAVTLLRPPRGDAAAAARELAAQAGPDGLDAVLLGETGAAARAAAAALAAALPTPSALARHRALGAATRRWRGSRPWPTPGSRRPTLRRGPGSRAAT